MKNKYKKENLEPIILKCKNWTEVLRSLNMGTKGNGRSTVQKYAKLHRINITHFESNKERYLRVNKKNGLYRKIPINEILISGSTYSNSNHLKIRLYKEGLKERKCEECGQGEIWRGKKISLILDHINGINNDNRIENLRILCPNCNATLPTHCKGHRKMTKLKNKLKAKKENIKKGHIKQRKIERPPYDILKGEIEDQGYSATGRKYGVSDNAIRKWLKNYEINNY